MINATKLKLRDGAWTRQTYSIFWEIFAFSRLPINRFTLLLRDQFIRLACILCCLPFGLVSASSGTTYIENPESYRARLETLKPGDHLQLLPGEYRHGLPLHHLFGTEQSRITISGPPNAPYAVLVGRSGQSTISITNSSYITIRNLSLDGRNLQADGVKCGGHASWAHHITLDGLRIYGHNHNQQIVGISTKCTAWNWVIRNNVITGAGTGLYLGNSDGSYPFIAGLIEYNLITDTRGYNLQIKHQQPHAIFPGMPRDINKTIIRHNVFSKAQGGSKQEMARPNVLVGHWPLTGPRANDQYVIYGNFFYQNPDESLFQGEGNIALYNNIFVNNFGDAVRIQPHNHMPRSINIFHNTILAAKTGIYLEPGEGSNPLYARWIKGNAVFASTPLIGGIHEDNIVDQYKAVENYLVRPFTPLGQMNLALLPDKQPDISPDTTDFLHHPEWNKDFDGAWSESRFGAYGYDKPPRWTPVLEIKQQNSTP